MQAFPAFVLLQVSSSAICWQDIAERNPHLDSEPRGVNYYKRKRISNNDNSNKGFFGMALVGFNYT
jgi:hypothetical protein